MQIGTGTILTGIVTGEEPGNLKNRRINLTMAAMRRASGGDECEGDLEEFGAIQTSCVTSPRYAVNVVDQAVNMEINKRRKVNDIESFIRSNALALKKKRLEGGKKFAEKQFKQMRLKLKQDRSDFEIQRIKKYERLKKLHETCREVAKKTLPEALAQRLSTERENLLYDTAEYYPPIKFTRDVTSKSNSPSRTHTLKSNLLSIHERISSGIDTLHNVGDEIAKQKVEKLKLKSETDEKIRTVDKSDKFSKKSSPKVSPSKKYYTHEMKKALSARVDVAQDQLKLDGSSKFVKINVNKVLVKSPKSQKIEISKKENASSAKTNVYPKYARINNEVHIADVSLLGLIESDVGNDAPVVDYTAHLSDHIEENSDSNHDNSTIKSSEIYLDSECSDDNAGNNLVTLTDDSSSIIDNIDIDAQSSSGSDNNDHEVHHDNEVEVNTNIIYTCDKNDLFEKDLNVLDQIKRMNELIVEINDDIEERLNCCNSADEVVDFSEDGDGTVFRELEIPFDSDGLLSQCNENRYIAHERESKHEVPYAIAAIKADQQLFQHFTETMVTTETATNRGISSSNNSTQVKKLSLSDKIINNIDLASYDVANDTISTKFIDDPLVQTQSLFIDRDDAIKNFNIATTTIDRGTKFENIKTKKSNDTVKHKLPKTINNDNSDDETYDNLCNDVAAYGATYKSSIPSVQLSNIHGLIPSLRNVGELSGMLDSQFKILSHERLTVPESSDTSKDYTDDESTESGDDDNRVVTLVALQLLKQSEESERNRIILLESKAIQSMTDNNLLQNIIQDNIYPANQTGEFNSVEKVPMIESAPVPSNESTSKNIIHTYFETNSDDRSYMDRNSNVALMPVLADISSEIETAILLSSPPIINTKSISDAISDDSNRARNMYSALELRQFMIDELRKQDEILKYELELVELEQTRAITSANDYVQQIVMRSQIESIENKKQQELVMQQQAYEISLTAALANAHITLKEESALHCARISEMQSQLQQQELLNDYAQLMLQTESLQRQSFPVYTNSKITASDTKLANKVNPVSAKNKPESTTVENDEIIEEDDDAYTSSFEQDRDSSVQEDLSVIERDKSRGSKYDSEYSDIFEEDIPEDIDSDDQSRKHTSVASYSKSQKLKAPITAQQQANKNATKKTQRKTAKESLIIPPTSSSSIDTNKILAEYKNEMEIRLKTQEKSIQIRLQLLKAKRSKSLNWLSEQKELILKAKTLQAKKGLMSIKQIDAEEKKVNDSYNEERVVLEREKWSLNARAYRELRKFQQLKQDMDSYEIAYEPDISVFKVNAVNTSTVYDSSASSNDSSFDLRKGEVTEKSKRSTKTLLSSKSHSPITKSDDSDTYTSPNKSYQSGKSKSPNNEFSQSIQSNKSLGSTKSVIASIDKPLKQYERPNYLLNDMEVNFSLNHEHALQEKKEYETHNEILEKNIVDRQLSIHQLKTAITNIEMKSKDHEKRRSKQIESAILENNERKLLSSLDNDIARIANELNTINLGLRVSKDSIDSKDSQFSSQEKMKEWIEAIHEPLHEEDSIMKVEDEIDNDSWASQEDIDSTFNRSGTLAKRTSSKNKQVPTLLSSNITNLDIMKRVKRDEAVTKIQCVVRGWSTRNHYVEYMTEIRNARNAIAAGSVIGDLPLEFIAANTFEDDVLEDSFGSNDGMEEFQVVQKLQKEQRLTNLLENKVNRMAEIKTLKESLASEQKHLEKVELLNQQKVEAELVRLDKVRMEAEVERMARQSLEAKRLAQSILEEENDKLAVIKRETELALIEKQKIEQEEKLEELRLTEMRKEIETLELLRISKIEEANRIVLKLKEESNTVTEIEQENVNRLRIIAEKLKQETFVEEERLADIAKQAELRVQEEEKRLADIAKHAALLSQEEEEKLSEISKQVSHKDEELKRLDSARQDAEIQAGIMSLKLKREAEEEADLLRQQLQSNAQKEANDLKVKLTNEVIQDVVIEQDKLSKLRLQAEIEFGRLEYLHKEKEMFIKSMESNDGVIANVLKDSMTSPSKEIVDLSADSNVLQYNSSSNKNDSSMLEETDESIFIEDKDKKVIGLDENDLLEQSGSATVAWDRDYRNVEGELTKSLSNSALCGNDNDSLSITSGTKTVNTIETREDANSLENNEDLNISDTEEYANESNSTSIPEDDSDAISEASSYDLNTNKLESSARSFGQSNYSHSHLSIANSSNNDDKDFSVVEEPGTISSQSYDLVKDNLLVATNTRNITHENVEIRNSINDISIITANTLSTADNSMLVDERALLESIDPGAQKDYGDYNIKEILNDQSDEVIDYEIEDYLSGTSIKPSLSSLSNIPPLSLNKIPKLEVGPSLGDELDDLYQFDIKSHVTVNPSIAHTVDTPRNEEQVITTKVPIAANWAPIILDISNNIIQNIDIALIVQKLKDETLSISDVKDFVVISPKHSVVAYALGLFSNQHKSAMGLNISESLIESVVDAINDRLSHILQEFQRIYHDKSVDSTKSSLDLLNLNKFTLIKSMPLTTANISSYISNSISSEQQIIQDIVCNKKNINDLVTLDTVESVVAEEDVVYKTGINNIVDTILANLIVDTAMAFRNRI